MEEVQKVGQPTLSLYTLHSESGQYKKSSPLIAYNNKKS